MSTSHDRTNINPLTLWHIQLYSHSYSIPDEWFLLSRCQGTVCQLGTVNMQTWNPATAWYPAHQPRCKTSPTHTPENTEYPPTVFFATQWSKCLLQFIIYRQQLQRNQKTKVMYIRTTYPWVKTDTVTLKSTAEMKKVFWGILPWFSHIGTWSCAFLFCFYSTQIMQNDNTVG